MIFQDVLFANKYSDVKPTVATNGFDLSLYIMFFCNHISAHISDAAMFSTKELNTRVCACERKK